MMKFFLTNLLIPINQLQSIKLIQTTNATKSWIQYPDDYLDLILRLLSDASDSWQFINKHTKPFSTYFNARYHEDIMFTNHVQLLSQVQHIMDILVFIIRNHFRCLNTTIHWKSLRTWWHHMDTWHTSQTQHSIQCPNSTPLFPILLAPK